MAQTPITYHFDGSGVGVGAGPATRRTVQGTYDFTVNTGGTGLYSIARLNKGAQIVGGWVEVIGTPTAVSGTPAIGINSVGTGDVLASASVLGAPWSTVGKKAILPKVNTPESTSLTMTADTNIQVAITTAAISTGKFTLYLDVIG
jgi:hypothetical protein